MIVTCYCGKEFRTYPSKVAIGRGKYCSTRCSLVKTNEALSKNDASRWEKGRATWNRKPFIFTRSRKGGKMYKLLYLPDHPNASKKGYIREHRFVMEQKIGRTLLANEVVHHLDRNTLNNDVHNLELLTAKEHSRLHVGDTVHKRWSKISPPHHGNNPSPDVSTTSGI